MAERRLAGAGPRRRRAATTRIPVRKTYKLYVGGQFPRSESGRSYVVRGADGAPLANAVRSSRKDLRDAIRTARGAVRRLGRQDRDEPRPGALSRGRADGRPPRAIRRRGRGRRRPAARTRPTAIVDRAIDRWVWYAGWADKISQVLGTVNPVGAPYFNFSIPEATGVVGVVAPEGSSLLGLVSRARPGRRRRQRGRGARVGKPAAAGRHAGRGPGHVDVPAGVINMLTGLRRELVPVLAAHMDVNALDIWGVPPRHARRR